MKRQSMRNLLAAASLLCASAASAGPLDVLMGIPDAPGVVVGGTFGPNGNDYYGDMHQTARRAALPARQARAKVHPAAREKRPPRS